MKKQTVKLEIGGGRDKLAGIEEDTDIVVVKYEQSGQERSIEIPIDYLMYVKNLIDGMEPGTRYASKYVYNKCIKHFRIKSQIVEERMKILAKVMLRKGLGRQTADEILEELEQHDDWMLMDFEELIGTRDTKTSDYFKIYGCIRYWYDKGVIDYTKRGGIYKHGT